MRGPSGHQLGLPAPLQHAAQAVFDLSLAALCALQQVIHSVGGNCSTFCGKLLLSTAIPVTISNVRSLTEQFERPERLAQHRLAREAQPGLQNTRIEAPEINSRLKIAILQVRIPQ